MVVEFDANKKDLRGADGMTMEDGANYGQFQERLREEVGRALRKEHPFTVMRVSVDQPVPVETPESSHIEQLLKASIRHYDLLCPLETSQFAIVFPETGEEYAELIANRIRGKVSQKGKSETFLLETEIGIACFPHDGENAEDLLESAEQDLISQRKRNQH